MLVYVQHAYFGNGLSAATAARLSSKSISTIIHFWCAIVVANIISQIILCYDSSYRSNDIILIT